ncbi:MAG TPA: response regulator transcription factor [Terriglobales bacterium]|nr:response regulator transcription factor [Terriglobales bacterium]
MNKIILADNQAIFRAGTAKILAIEDDFRIIAQCSDPGRLFQVMEAFRGATLIFASSLKINTLQVMARVRSIGSRAVIIAENHEPIQPFLADGVNGAVHRSVSGPSLIDCMRRVIHGERGVIANGCMGTIHEDDPVGVRVRDRLTPKEMKIVALIIQGCKNKEIAMRLITTEQVVKNYLRSIYDKTGVSDRLELALFTIHHRMLAEAAIAAGEMLMQAN